MSQETIVETIKESEITLTDADGDEFVLEDLDRGIAVGNASDSHYITLSEQNLRDLLERFYDYEWEE